MKQRVAVFAALCLSLMSVSSLVAAEKLDKASRETARPMTAIDSGAATWFVWLVCVKTNLSSSSSLSEAMATCETLVGETETSSKVSGH